MTVFERDDRIGGLLRYGIPDFKMEKWRVDRRLRQMEAEGVVFKPGVDVGRDIPPDRLLSEFDAVCLCGGATRARDLPIPGRELKGDPPRDGFPPAFQNRRLAGDPVTDDPHFTALDKDVVIIGGGDTGADCLGTSHRQGCRSVHQFEIVPRPPEARASANPWPQWSNVFRVSGAHEEGGVREYSISTRRFLGEDGRVTALETVQVEMKRVEGRPQFVEVPGTEKTYPADLVLLAMGFVGPERVGLLDDLGVELDRMGNVKADANKRTSVDKVFTAGDMTRGQSLIVWAIAEGRHAAHGIDKFLMGQSDLPRPLGLRQQLPAVRVSRASMARRLWIPRRSSPLLSPSPKGERGSEWLPLPLRERGCLAARGIALSGSLPDHRRCHGPLLSPALSREGRGSQKGPPGRRSPSTCKVSVGQPTRGEGVRIAPSPLAGEGRGEGVLARPKTLECPSIAGAEPCP